MAIIPPDKIEPVRNPRYAQNQDRGRAFARNYQQVGGTPAEGGAPAQGAVVPGRGNPEHVVYDRPALTPQEVLANQVKRAANAAANPEDAAWQAGARASLSQPGGLKAYMAANARPGATVIPTKEAMQSAMQQAQTAQLAKLSNPAFAGLTNQQVFNTFGAGSLGANGTPELRPAGYVSPEAGTRPWIGATPATANLGAAAQGVAQGLPEQQAALTAAIHEYDTASSKWPPEQQSQYAIWRANMIDQLQRQQRLVGINPPGTGIVNSV